MKNFITDLSSLAKIDAEHVPVYEDGVRQEEEGQQMELLGGRMEVLGGLKFILLWMIMNMVEIKIV